MLLGLGQEASGSGAVKGCEAVQGGWRVHAAAAAAAPSLSSRSAPACVTVPPASRLHLKTMQYGSDVVPLLKRLKYDPKFDPAFRQVGSECRWQVMRGGRRCTLH